MRLRGRSNPQLPDRAPGTEPVHRPSPPCRPPSSCGSNTGRRVKKYLTGKEYVNGLQKLKDAKSEFEVNKQAAKLTKELVDRLQELREAGYDDKTIGSVRSARVRTHPLPSESPCASTWMDLP